MIRAILAMNRCVLHGMHLSIALLTILAVGAPSAGEAQAVTAGARTLFDAAYFAWDRGDYPASLEHLEALLSMPESEPLLARIALLTGERYEVQEIARDGQNVRWSPVGSHLTFEVGTGSAARTHLVEVTDAGPRVVEEFEGWGAHISPDGTSIAYFRVPIIPALEAARQQEREALDTGDNAALREARQRIADLEYSNAQIVLRSLATGEEQVLGGSGLDRFSISFLGNGTVVLVGRDPGEDDRRDLYMVPVDGPPVRLSDGPGIKGARVLRFGERGLVYTIGNDRFAIHDVGSGAVRIMEGSAPALSRDGSTLVYLAVVREGDPELRRGEAAVGADVRANGNVNAVMLLDLTGDNVAREVKRTTLPLSDPAVSPSGTRVAYNIVLRDDWEIFVVDADGTGESRVTRDIQHDLYPHFLSEDRILAVMGEARHRRAYLYDLARDHNAEIAAALPGDDQRGRMQLFHNNTLRTVAPQYDWVPNPEGNLVAIVADRDGDTLSPERGVFLVHLGREVTRDALLARVRSQLEAERELRSWGREIFAPIESQVRAATGEVDAGRVYDHAHALYQFGSKFITQPGNALAIEYITNSLRAMGYEPELQWFEPRPGVQSANVVATLRGTERPERINVISSHLDSVERGPGADDNTSGTTALLEAARVLANRPQPETIEFAFLTGEEAGLLGAREFVRRALANGDLIVGALNNDMIGWTRSHRLDNTIRYSNDTIRDIQHNAAILFSDLITYDARYVRSTDAQAFWDNYGDIIGGIGSYPILGNPHYHQPHDQLEVIDHRLVAEVSRTTVATIMRLANGVDLEDR